MDWWLSHIDYRLKQINMEERIRIRIRYVCMYAWRDLDTIDQLRGMLVEFFLGGGGNTPLWKKLCGYIVINKST